METLIGCVSGVFGTELKEMAGWPCWAALARAKNIEHVTLDAGRRLQLRSGPEPQCALERDSRFGCGPA